MIYLLEADGLHFEKTYWEESNFVRLKYVELMQVEVHFFDVKE